MKLAIPKLSCGVTRRGAQMGRPDHVPHDCASARLSLRRLALDRGGYDPAGAYWGLGAPLWRAAGHSPSGPVEIYTRACSREQAKRLLLAAHPGARFAR